jgi:hypothetical protein
MRIHTDNLTADDLRDALDATGFSEGVRLAECYAHRSRSRHHAFEVGLEALPGRDRNGKARRPRANGYDAGSSYTKGATYDEWGYWIAELFARDETLIFGPYRDADDFERKTRYAFEVPTRA